MIYGGLLFELVALKCELYESVPILIASIENHQQIPTHLDGHPMSF